MRKLLMIMTVGVLLAFDAMARTVITPMQVKEIWVHSSAGGFRSYTSASIKIVCEAGEWHSYLMQTSGVQVDLLGKAYCGPSRHPIAVINPILVDRLLTGIAFPKPAMSTATFGINAPGLIRELKATSKLPVITAPDLEKVISQQAVDSAIAKSVVHLVIMDAFAYCEVDVVSRRNDTVKLMTRNLCATKLPWTLNKKVTYDMAINNFVVAAMGREYVPNKDALDISSLKESIYNYIDGHNTGAPIAEFRWKHDYPVNLNLLTTHFTLVAKKLIYPHVYSCSLKTRNMPTNAILNSVIDMSKDEDTRRTVAYAGLIDNYFKVGNFVLNYYINRPRSHISFSYYTGQSPYYPVHYLAKKLPDRARMDSTKTVSFWVGEPDDSAQWVVFPDQQCLVQNHIVTTPNGKTAPIYPQQNSSPGHPVSSAKYYLFDRSGKVLRQGIAL